MRRSADTPVLSAHLSKLILLTPYPLAFILPNQSQSNFKFIYNPLANSLRSYLYKCLSVRSTDGKLHKDIEDSQSGSRASTVLDESGYAACEMNTVSDTVYAAYHVEFEFDPHDLLITLTRASVNSLRESSPSSAIKHFFTTAFFLFILFIHKSGRFEI